MANERTFLAWIRTSIGIMAFGFVVEKFALFIRQIGFYLTSHDLGPHQNFVTNNRTNSSLFGISLVGIGALIGLLSFINYKKTQKQIEDDNFRYTSFLANIVTVLVVIIGIFLVAYLLNAP